MSLAATCPYYLANVPEMPNQDLEVRDKYSGEVATRVAVADDAAIDRAIAMAVEATEPMARLAAYERKAVLEHCVARFRERYDAAAPPAHERAAEDADVYASDPLWEIPRAIAHESGWRPLDDVTLWRFLAADRSHRGRADGGSFDAENSWKRLTNTLRWRRTMQSWRHRGR